MSKPKHADRPVLLSALIIARDEEQDLPLCLLSLREAGIFDEIVVLVDEATADRTESLAREAGCLTARRKFDDYARQRQAALELCSGDWVLWIDADETLSPRLARAIKEAVDKPRAEAYAVRFSVRFMGRLLRFGGLGSEAHVRLFRRAAARFTGGLLHEGLLISGRVAGPLPGRIEHLPYRDLSEYLRKLDRYTTLSARMKRRAGGRFHWWHHFILPCDLLRRVVFRLGFLDGFPGLAWASLSAFHHWLKYAKLKEMEESR
ncbi:MAG: glycosyltransferase family 2 protein [Elusimicrobia bacterium]|nr:glycosyltransferase family 2 protein [Elusimicrobiota bacterium]MDE2424881.1 glycosyltransferase family 2 protein [Elusimicrobiota bacterium]